MKEDGPFLHMQNEIIFALNGCLFDAEVKFSNVQSQSHDFVVEVVKRYDELECREFDQNRLFALLRDTLIYCLRRLKFESL